MTTPTDQPAATAPTQPATMTAIRHGGYSTGPARVLSLGTAPVPAPLPHQVLVRVGAASVDQGTWHLTTGLPYPVRAAFPGIRRPRRLNPGLPFAGTIIAVGAEVTGLHEGDEVFGEGLSTFAEFAVADAAKVALKPADVTFADAAAAAVSAVTALQAVRDQGKVGAGQRVLVLGAGGGVGSYAVQLAKAAGAHVTAVCSTGKVDAVRGLGSDVVVDYRVEEPTGRFDVILDTGGIRPLRALRKLLTERGRLVIVGGENGGRWLGGSQRQVRAMALSPFVRQTLVTFMSRPVPSDLAEIAGRLERGELRSLVAAEYPLAETAAAVQRLAEGGPAGKVVIRVA